MSGRDDIIELDQVIDHVYLGDIFGATSLESLQAHNITHIVNLSMLENAYPDNFKYLRLVVRDFANEPIHVVFDDVIAFVDDALSHDEANVFIHCQAGISRSVTVLIAWLMRRKNMTLDNAMQLVREKRSCAGPNEGFLRQLVELHEELFPDVETRIFTRDDNSYHNDSQRLMTQYILRETNRKNFDREDQDIEAVAAALDKCEGDADHKLESILEIFIGRAAAKTNSEHYRQIASYFTKLLTKCGEEYRVAAANALKNIILPENYEDTLLDYPYLFTILQNFIAVFQEQSIITQEMADELNSSLSSLIS